MRRFIVHVSAAGIFGWLLAGCSSAAEPIRMPGFVPPPMGLDDFAWIKNYDEGLHPRVSLITVEPGSSWFELFGETALRVRVPKSKSDRIFGYCAPALKTGTSPWALARRFLSGSLEYELRSHPAAAFLTRFEHSGRGVVEQELHLGFAQAKYVVELLERNLAPETRAYPFDVQRQNCTTRVRDILNAALDGTLLVRLSEKPSPLTLREQALRFAAERPLATIGVDLFFGSRTDQKETLWSNAFVPQALQQALTEIHFTGVHGSADLVKSTRSLSGASGRGIRRTPPSRTLDYLQAGGIFGLVIGLLVSRAEWAGRRVGWVAVAMLSGLASLMGVIGCVVVWASVLSQQAAFVHNQNWLAFPPWLIAMPLLAWYGWWKERDLQIWFWTLSSALGAGILALVACLLGVSKQQSLPVLSLCLPVLAGLVFAAQRLKRSSDTLPGTKPRAS